MAHGLNSVLKRNSSAISCKNEGKTGIGSRRIFPPHFKLQVLDSYRNDADCKGNQRATARKYGIHRRQIQKWLQAENNLRNSVGKGKSGDCASNPEARKCGIELALRSVEHRQRDDCSQDAYCLNAGGADARVPAISPVAYNDTTWYAEDHRSPLTSGSPLDFTTHSRVHASPAAASPVPSPCDPASPIDLSLKRPKLEPAAELNAPVYLAPSPLTSVFSDSPPRLQSPITLTCLGQTQCDVWDLSTKTNKRKCDELSDSLYSPSSTSSSSSTQNSTQKPVKLFKPYLDDIYDNSNNSDDNKQDAAPICNYKPTYQQLEILCCNNNICNVKTENSYTLHELQPKNSMNYYYPVSKSYCLYSTPECEMLPPHYSPYEETTSIHLSPPLKQRQSYSIDFKLSAIECYYQDEFCRYNQRAVASKYNIHRRQVQKWLKQEDELRQKNESVKHFQIVR